jgi:hypothetical protein
MQGQPLRGLVGQGLRGKRQTVGVMLGGIVDLNGVGVGSYTLPFDCQATIMLWGAGGSGHSSVGGSSPGGGGGGSILARRRFFQGQKIEYQIGVGGAAIASGMGAGSPGGDSWARLPDGSVLVGTGGQGGSGFGGSGGSGYGPAVKATSIGGQGGASSTNGGSGQDGGGTGGLGSGGAGGGGGPAGFKSRIIGLTQGRGGSVGGVGPTLGGGGAGSTTVGSQAGAEGRLLLYLVRVN